MRIVDVSEFYAERGGGVKTYVHQKLLAGARAGHEVVVVAPGPRAAVEEKLGGKIVWIPSPPLPLDPRYYVLWNERAVHRALDELRPDVVEGSSPWSGGWFAARWRGEAAKAFVFHQDPIAVYPETLLDRLVSRDTINRWCSPYWRTLQRLSDHFDATITSGAWLAEKLGGFGLRRPEAVPFGIDRERFGPERGSEALRRALLARCGRGPDAKLLLCVSRMHPEKRLGTVLEAFSRASLSTERELALVIFGDGPTKACVRRRAARIAGVHLAGYTSDPNELANALASADALLHGSAAETYGLVVAEAIVSGLPVVVPDIGGAADLAEPGYSETYPPGHPESASRAIHLLLDRDRDSLRRACVEAADRKVRTMDEHFEALFAFYETLVARPRAVALESRP